MDITSFIAGGRQKFLLEGDHSSYKKHLTQQLHHVRKRLGRTTPKNAKYSAKAPITAADIAQNKENAHILILSAERAWAHAWSIKLNRPETQKITGSTRQHVNSRFHKAAGYAAYLADVLLEQSASRAGDRDVLEAQAYTACLAGAQELHKQSNVKFDDPSVKKRAWRPCLASFSEAHIIYTALFTSTKTPVFKDFLDSDIEQNLRYAAYQSGLSRTLPSSAIAKKSFRRDASDLITRIEKFDPEALSDEKTVTATSATKASDIPSTITWRAHTVPLVDASIGQALAATNSAADQLTTTFSNASSVHATSSAALAAAYDPVLTFAQETVDVTRRAISEISKEGIPESDQRMQHLRVADLAVNYDLVSWRVGRNRVLIGGSSSDDGISFTAERPNIPPRQRKNGQEWTPRPESMKHMLARLQQRVVLYDATLQSIDSVKLLRGAARDEAFVDELDSTRAYFQALKCLNIGFSHSLLDQYANALALFARAEQLAPKFMPLSSSAHAAGTPPTIEVSPTQLTHLRQTLTSLVTQTRGTVTLHSLIATDASKETSSSKAPLIDNLHAYPASGTVDLENLVPYPPKLQAVPVKPIFLDLAWNYIDYPGRQKVGFGNENTVQTAETVAGTNDSNIEEKKRGWFGFGRG